MKQPAHKFNGISRVIFDAMPALVLVVDEDLRIQEFNQAAARALGGERAAVLQRRAGNALHCLNATEAPGGCGSAPICAVCVLRKATRVAIKGQPVQRQQTRFERCLGTRQIESMVYVTAASIQLGERNLALLIIEIFQEISNFHRLVPVCCSCRKVRQGESEWTGMETYFARHGGVHFTQGICPDCRREEIQRLHQDCLRELIEPAASPGPEARPALPAPTPKKTPSGRRLVLLDRLKQTLAICGLGRLAPTEPQAA
jgi:hypothetical protein